ncbi:MAG: phosphopantetheine adenylyltransferase [Alphaproteobacteria bacterium]|nr:phosphopantetheine adenylyltransferase [Alphaproteobacteria bacterium]
MPVLIGGLMILVGVIHLLPLVGALGPARLEALYGLPMEDPNLEILMRHRAVMFGLLGGLFVYAALDATVQPLAFGIAGVTILSFLAIARSVGGYNDKLARVVLADRVALAALVIAVGLYAAQGG